MRSDGDWLIAVVPAMENTGAHSWHIGPIVNNIVISLGLSLL